MSKALAEKTAKDLLKKYNYEVPIDLEKISADLGVEVLYEPLEDHVSGLFINKGQKNYICINKGHHSNRQRFTLAHELGHYLLHSCESKFFVDEPIVLFRETKSVNNYDSNEIEANTFAAELLMPKKTLLEELNKDLTIDIFDDVSTKKLAKKFGVSIRALIIRLTKLNLIRA